MDNVAQHLENVNIFYLPDVTAEQDWREYREAMDYASRWAFWVYEALVQKWGREVAGKAARATYERLLLNGYTTS